MSILITFASKRPFHQQFYLNLPQSYKRQQPLVLTSHSAGGSTIGSPTTGVSSILRTSATPVSLFGTTRLYPSTAVITRSPSTNATTNVAAASGSNDSWELDELMKTNPKMAKLMGRHKKSADTKICFRTMDH